MKRTLNRNSAIGGVILDDLPGMSRAALLDAWAQVIGKPPVFSARLELLVNAIAWHLQARQFGGLAPSVHRKLERLAGEITRGDHARPLTATDPPPPRPTLERTWPGRRTSSPSWRAGSPIAVSNTAACRRSRGSSRAPAGTA